MSSMLAATEMADDFNTGRKRSAGLRRRIMICTRFTGSIEWSEDATSPAAGLRPAAALPRLTQIKPPSSCIALHEPDFRQIRP
jgi:hypothetical protein